MRRLGQWRVFRVHREYVQCGLSRCMSTFLEFASTLLLTAIRHLLGDLQSDVVVGFPDESITERLDKEEPGWKNSGKYVRDLAVVHPRH